MSGDELPSDLESLGQLDDAGHVASGDLPSDVDFEALEEPRETHL